MTTKIIQNIFKDLSILNYSIRKFSLCHVYYVDKVAKHLNPFKKKSFGKFNSQNESKISSRICLTIIGNGAVGQPRCLGLFTDARGFLFNCGEGVGRLCREYEIDITQIRNIFVTQKIWKNVSGLPDIFVTHDVFGVPKMYLYGPPGIEHFTNVISSQFHGTKLSKRLFYSDENVDIQQIPLHSCKSKHVAKFSPELGDYPGRDVCYSFACKIHKHTGELNTEKCVELGVPFGPHLLKLKNGENITLPSGKTINSTDVVDSSHPEITFLVVDCPSEDFLDSLLHEEQFHEYQNAAEFVFHFSPPDVMQSNRYQTWMQKFHKNVKHYVLNEANPCSNSRAVIQIQNIFNLLHSDIFKILPHNEAKPIHLSVSSEIVYPPSMLQIYIRPELKLVWDNVSVNSTEDLSIIQEELPEFNQELNKLKTNTLPKYDIPDINSNKAYPEILFLGTSSATSTAFRNVSAILVNIDSHKSILLDCGEGTHNQMVQYFGRTGVNDVLRNLSCIFVSHLHTDHYLGVFELVKARIEAFEKTGMAYQTITLILPFAIQDILSWFTELFEPLKSKVRILTCKYQTVPGATDDLSGCLGDVKLLTVPVKHCHDAFGVVLEKDSQWKIVYSGDTSPSQKLIDAGKNCTLLIHEASIEDNLLGEAFSRKHSTPSQVIDVSEKMGARYTIMTHFSKRYLAVPVPIFEDSHYQNVSCAFDFMKVNLNQLPLLKSFLPALKCLFKDQMDEHLKKSCSVPQFENVFLRKFRSLKAN